MVDRGRGTDGTEVSFGDQKRIATGPVELPRGTAPLVLTFTADGYFALPKTDPGSQPDADGGAQEEAHPRDRRTGQAAGEGRSGDAGLREGTMTRLWLLIVVAGCTTLPPIARDTCGNGILEPGEDCDSTAATCVAAR